ncbi:MAG: hypothetical protein V7703_22190, partial [Hyphomicrobiales bacterium]
MSSNPVFLRTLVFLCMFGFFPALPANGNDQLCHVIGRDIVGEPIELTMRWPIDADRPPDLLERPAETSSIENLFSDIEGGSDSDAGCSGGGIVGVLNCDLIAPMQNASSDKAEGENGQTSDQINSIDKDKDAANTNGTENNKNEKQERDYSRYAYATITMRPVLRPGTPPRVVFAAENTNFKSDPALGSKDLYDRVKSDLSFVAKHFRGASLQLDDESMKALGSGQAWPSLDMAILSGMLKTPNTRLTMPDEVQFPKRCGDLIATENAAGKAVNETLPLRKKLADLRNRKRLLDHAKPERI